MTNSNSVKRSLIASIVSVSVCVLMALGTTFAWFTDSAKTAVNKIQAGELKVDIVNESGTESVQNTGLKFKNADGISGETLLWEPGCTYKTEGFKIKNNGNLALKYKLALNGITGDSDLLKVISFSVVKEDGSAVDLSTFEGTLNAKNELSEVLYIQGHMAESASNFYQGKELTGLGLTVVATQDTYESDSKDNSYDELAEYPVIVNNTAEFTTAIRSAVGGETIILGSDIDLSSIISINKKLTINLAGYSLSSSAQYTLQLNFGADVTVTDSSAGAAGVLTNTYSGKATPYAAVDLKGKGAVFTLESGTVQSNANDNFYSIAIGNSGKKECTVNINGGTVSNPDGHIKSRAIHASNGMTVNINGGIVNGGLCALDTYVGSVSNINGGKLYSNAVERRNDEYGKSYAIRAKGEAQINIGSQNAETVPNVKGIIFEASGVKTALPKINLLKGEITNPIYSKEPKSNYSLFKLGITADAPVTFIDNTASYFLNDDLQMIQSGSVWKVTSK